MEKIVSLKKAGAMVQNGQWLALGGNTLHRSPSAFIKTLCALKKRDLKIIKTAGAYDIDLLCAFNCVSEVHAGYVGYENLGLALHYRYVVEKGITKAMENSCYSVIAGLRAAAYGVPFMPINGFQGSDLPLVRGFKYLQNPYGKGEEILVVPALKPDWAIIHVQYCDKKGNAVIQGPAFEDELMSRAAKGVIITTEEIVEEVSPGDVRIPHFMVNAIIHAPRGAFPCSCPGIYDADYGLLAKLRTLSQNEIMEYVMEGDKNE